ncbi:D-3-phosphoglycerate dehydrogenase [Halorhabdus utahensis DSM 12940]|uniref:D-3-phosphoglycerate dehydrogenase n=1 Tax=Halorhabdus utahensis (strain DSM 12940 / JCM 11049 / AX-2) TaxID=519442 RepID=C7NP80_HALUD|nr:NAD(P)-dependent oxidoreductase [Halorhabdus utahensis]ACV11667.1 D-3-phosphoglycerate dehydrogenase [Halorhabdus utahensis DSM 12940]
MEIVVTSSVEDAGLAALTDAGHDVRTVSVDGAEELAVAAEGAAALIVDEETPVPAAVFERATDVQIVGRTGIDVDGIDVATATEHGVIVANGPEADVQAVAEYIIGLLFATARGIPQGHVRLKDGEWAKGDIIGSELDGKTAGLVGFDSVGQEVAKRLDNLGLDVVVYAPDGDGERAAQIGAERVDLDTCLDRADFLSMHAGADAIQLGERELDALGEAYLVNGTDGNVVDESALANAAEDGDLQGAALDAVSVSPLPDDSPLRDVENILVTPEIASHTATNGESASASVAAQVLAAFDGQPVSNAVNVPSIPPDAYPVVKPYADLTETVARIAIQLFDGDLESVSIEYAGDIVTETIEPITAAGLTGVFDPLGWDANQVNARHVADEHGIDVDVSTIREAPDFQNLVTVTVSGGGDELSVEGTQFADGEPRIVSIDRYWVEAIPHGHMLIVRNADEPGVIGFIGTVLGEYDVNIAGMFNAREAIGGEALSVYNLDDEPGEDVLAALNDDDRILETTVVELNGQNARE